MTRRNTGRDALTVFAKEIVDALRDRRTLLVVLLSSVLMGPLVLVALSGLIATFESRAEQREVWLDGMDNAPTLVNFLQRQTYTVHAAPAGYERALRDLNFADPVIVVPRDFEAKLAQGEAPVLEVVSDSANKRSEAGTGRVDRLLQGFNRERAMLALALRGVAGELLEPVQVDDRDLASTATRGAQFTGMLPFFVLMAVLYGALNAALDSTAGERERGSLEPLLMNPADRVALVLGKWGAVACVGMLIAVLSCFSFIPAQWLLRSDTLAALFQYGVREALLFLVVLLPFAAALSAVLMAVAIRCRSFKEAQANATVVVLGVSLLPLFSIFNLGGEARWHLWVPALGQNVLMNRVLKGETVGVEAVLAPLAVCVVLTALGIWLVARTLHSAAVR
jgi:sodium transport system permease protein